MEIKRIEDMTRGWFIGNFTPSVLMTSDFEVGYLCHKKGETWGTHYHKRAVEINYLIRGKMRIQGQLLTTGDIFTIFPYEIADARSIDPAGFGFSRKVLSMCIGLRLAHRSHALFR